MPLDTDRLLDQARQLTGLDDFGDPDFRVGLDVLAASMDEADFDDFGTMASEGAVLGLLCNRLAVEAWYAANPGIADERIERPIFTIGLSRTGTTALMVTHDLAEAATIADRVVLLSDGHVVMDRGGMDADEIYDAVRNLDPA